MNISIIPQGKIKELHQTHVMLRYTTRNNILVLSLTRSHVTEIKLTDSYNSV